MDVEYDGYAGANTTMSSCDYSMSQFKDEPLSELPADDESMSGEEENIPLVSKFVVNLVIPNYHTDDILII